MLAAPAPPDHHDCIVLGAGISGLVSASVLRRGGAQRILVVDEYEHVGGNHIDAHVGPYTFDVGSLIFQDDSPLLDHFPELLDRYVPITPSWGRLNPQGRVTAYPFSVRDDLLRAGPVELLMIAASAVRARLGRRPLHSAQDFADHWLGRRFVHRSGLGNYMTRFCGRHPAEVDLEFAEQRMGWIATQAEINQLAKRLLPRRGDPPPTNRQLARPASGFADLYAPAVATLGSNGVRFALGADMQSVSRQDGHFQLRLADGVHTADRLVSTIPVDAVLALCGVQVGAPLPAVRLISLFLSFGGSRGFEPSVLYNFSHSGAWKRLTVYSDFYGPREEREYFGVEVIASDSVPDADAAMTDFRQHTATQGLLAGDLRLEGSHVLDQAYPIYTGGSGQTARHRREQLAALGVESLGRQGAFAYQPTARVSALEAEAALARGPARPAS